VVSWSRSSSSTADSAISHRFHDRRIRRGLDTPMSSARAARELAAEVYRSEPLTLTDS
jgi:hypothetical protein